jgi:hypothetical protein
LLEGIKCTNIQEKKQFANLFFHVLGRRALDQERRKEFEATVSYWNAGELFRLGQKGRVLGLMVDGGAEVF